ncbi:HAMP domain-containing sensor histidine kinase [Proteiniclasticum sp. QWL-01]|uniref:sensor histidine kinase n=1 Tax=Proteiniclasticum sp. QWL-01 TaxID=3036945 RepID=UPI00240F3CCD|nr:HAMP domain-containing sensor histidine kinase [Proteiniclasticum sp. QWL-01]WFF72076.1 HAMP domain-containing sensor histidine kinase [Proteiniclasticum sp. QWL-01]
MEKRVRQGSIRASFIKSILLILGMTYILTLAVLLSFVRAYFYTNFYNTVKGQVQYSADYYEDNISTTGTLIENLYADQDSWWHSDGARVQIYDTSAQLLLDSQAHLESESELLDVRAALNGQTEYHIFKIGQTNEHVMSISTPLISTGKVIGVIRHIASLEQVDQNLLNITILFFQIGGAITAAAAMIGIFMSKKMIDPITELTETARQMAKGVYNVKSPVMSNDEIGTLSQTFNYMASEIAKKEELKNEFISSVSHELRTPLTAIKGWAVTLNDPATDPELLAMGLDIIEKESDRLKAMVNELLDFSRFASGKIDLKLDQVEPEQLKKFILSFVEGRKEREPRSFQLVMEESVAPFTADINRIKQVLVNLIDNAFKFTEPGDSIQVEVAQDLTSTWLTVKDTGIGIAPDEIPKVREKFYKGKHSKSSSGIGLSIVNEIALLHGGSLEIDSELNQGTRMRVRIPREVSNVKKNH